jgi:hypothetical protein
MEPPETPAPVSWRSSELPSWKGPKGFTFDGSNPAPYKGHRWLPVRDYDVDIINTAAHDIDPEGWGLVRSWAAAAQLHYSFLEHLERDELYKYQADYWDYHYRRISINFLAIRGQDIVDAFPLPAEDEVFLTMDRPKELGRHVWVDGSGTAAHFAFVSQRYPHEDRGIAQTDLLSRYKAYADEMVCPYPNRKNSPGSKKSWWRAKK